jgi:hypothetical protein
VQWALEVEVRSRYGVIVSTAFRVTPEEVPRIVTVTVLVRVKVVTVNGADREPAGIITLAGTVARVVLVLDNVMVRFAAVTPLRVTVPAELVPPFTEDGLNVKDANDGT